jgi:hypothetical protein
VVLLMSTLACPGFLKEPAAGTFGVQQALLLSLLLLLLLLLFRLRRALRALTDALSTHAAKVRPAPST